MIVYENCSILLDSRGKAIFCGINECLAYTGAYASAQVNSKQ